MHFLNMLANAISWIFFISSHFVLLSIKLSHMSKNCNKNHHTIFFWTKLTPLLTKSLLYKTAYFHTHLKLFATLKLITIRILKKLASVWHCINNKKLGCSPAHTNFNWFKFLKICAKSSGNYLPYEHPVRGQHISNGHHDFKTMCHTEVCRGNVWKILHFPQWFSG